MAIWGEVELLCRAVEEKARRQTEQLLAEARAEAGRIASEARANAEAERQRELLAVTSRAQGEARQLVDSAEFASRKRLVTFRKEALRETWDALERHLQERRRLPDYAQFLPLAVQEGVEQLGGEAFIVELNPEDLEALGGELIRWAEARSVALTLQPSREFDGGVRVYTADRRLRFDNSLAARMKRLEDEIRLKIWSVLFGTDAQ